MSKEELIKEIWDIWEMLGKIDHPETNEVYHYVNQLVLSFGDDEDA